MQTWDDVVAHSIGQEAPLLGFEVDWFPIDRPECAGGKAVLHVVRDGVSYHVPLSRCTSREALRKVLLEFEPSSNGRGLCTATKLNTCGKSLWDTELAPSL